MFYKKIGRGRNLVLLHGWASAHAIWEPLIAYLHHDFCIHLFDLPGHGNSAASSCSLHHPQALIDTIRRQTPQDAIWVGWSLGAILGLLQQKSLPALVCVNMGIRFLASQDWPWGMPRHEYNAFVDLFSTAPKRSVKRFNTLQSRGDYRSKALYKQLQSINGAPVNTSELKGGLKLLDSDLRHTVSATPILFVAGQNDALVSAQNLRHSAAMAPQYCYAEIEHAGHALCLSHPGTLAQHISHFIANEL